jgi:hypothetical protein
MKYDPLKLLKLSKEQKTVLKLCVKYYKHLPDKLICFLYSIDWTKPS